MRYISLITRVVLFVFILALAPCIVGAASPQDAALASDVEKRLMTDKNFDATNITVSAENGVIHLRGTLKSRVEAQKLINSAKKAPGVKDVTVQFDFSNDGS